MTEYPLYLESGPMHKRTIGHVFDLLGCTVNGPTTEDAIASAPEAIREYLRFLAEHGEPVDPDAEMQTPVAVHVVERGYAAYGDVTPGFPPDFEPLERDRLDAYVSRYGWLHDDMVGLARRGEASLDDLLPGGKWPVRRLLEHVAEAEYEYLRCSLGHIDGLRKEVRAVVAQGDPAGALDLLHVAIADRLTATTPEELATTVQRGAKTWTVARTCRRILEHRWEHLQQLSAAVPSAAD